MPRYGKNWVYYKTDGARLKKFVQASFYCVTALLYESECNSKRY